MKTLLGESRFVSLSDTDTWGWIILCCGCIVGYVAASLASTYQMPLAPHTYTELGQPVVSPDIAKCPLIGNVTPTETR